MGEKGKLRGKALMRWPIFLVGITLLALGIALTITASLGNAPWDVLHIGLYYQFGLSIGMWSILVGIVLVALTMLLVRRLPGLGMVLNMILVGLFIDLFLALLKAPNTWLWKLVLLLLGTLVMGIGTSLYIAARCGAGPRDGLMLAICEKTGWKVSHVRTGMELVALFFGWLLGGPVFIGTLVVSLMIGPIVGFSLPYCYKLVDQLMGGVPFEDFDKGPVRVNHHDGVS